VAALATDGIQTDKRSPVIPWPAGLPVYDHIVIVVEENKDYDDIIGNPNAGYINDTLKTEGASFTRMFAEEHDSQGNYFWLFSGDNQGVGFKDDVPDGQPFTTANLGVALRNNKRTFQGFAENLPEVGWKAAFGKEGKKSLYVRKHVPWISFKEILDSCNLRFPDDFPKDFKDLPTVAVVIPNLANDMHNGELQSAITTGDKWLKANLDAYYHWAKENNSLLIVTWDESQNHKVNGKTFSGLTDPAVMPKSKDDKWGLNEQNRIATIFAGAHVKQGEYSEGNGITHVNILRTIEAMYGLPRAGAQQRKAAAAGIRDDQIITDIFAPSK
jgi:hypothetical protein